MGTDEYKKYVDNYLLGIENHETYSGKVNRLALNSFDNEKKHMSSTESNPWA